MPRLRVHGIQTGIVVGPTGKTEVEPGGDDIATDAHGRIQVKLVWDATEPDSGDRTTTCFLRVAQAWGGNGWGTMFVPRVGMEVFVIFVNGDPSHPVVIGSVYNGLNRPCYEQPAAKTKSYIRTQSSPSGKGFNELCFEDLSGHEQVYVHAQRDFDAVVEHDQSTLVHASQRNTVDKDQTENIGGEQSLTVTGRRTKQVGGSEEKGEENAIHGDRSTTISKNELLTVGERQKHQVGKGREVTIHEGNDNCIVEQGHKTTRVAKKFTQESQDQFAIAQGSDGKTKVVLKDAVLVQTQGDLTLKNDKARIYAAGSGKLLHEASEELKLVCGSASIQLTKDGKVKITGLEVTVGTATNNLTCDSKGATLRGAIVSIAATVLSEIKATLTKIGC